MSKKKQDVTISSDPFLSCNLNIYKVFGKKIFFTVLQSIYNFLHCVVINHPQIGHVRDSDWSYKCVPHVHLCFIFVTKLTYQF